jgi:hypothetical protein
MIASSLLSSLLGLSAVVHGSPLMPRAGTLTADTIQQIAPDTANCPSSGDFFYECRTAEQAAPRIAKSFQDYGLTTPGEQAAALSIMLFESAEFKYNRNHWPGRPGQGTRNMQMPNFNLLYAKSLFSADKVTSAQSSGGVVGVLNILRPDEYAFGSAAWFIKTQCSADIQKGLQSGTQAGWEAYITDCVGTTPDGRLAYWQKSIKALNA